MGARSIRPASNWKRRRSGRRRSPVRGGGEDRRPFRGTCVSGWGDVWRRLGRQKEAREQFVLARDLDALRFRADSRINGDVREVAAAAREPPECVWWMRSNRWRRATWPWAAFLATTCSTNTFTSRSTGTTCWRGRVLEQVCRRLPQLAASRAARARPFKRTMCGIAGADPWDECEMARLMTGMTSRPPFTDQLDHAVSSGFGTKADWKSLVASQATPQALRAACAAYEAAMEKTPDDWQLHYRFGRLAWRTTIGPTWLRNTCRSFAKNCPWERVGVQRTLARPNARLRTDRRGDRRLQKALELDPRFAIAHEQSRHRLETAEGGARGYRRIPESL